MDFLAIAAARTQAARVCPLIPPHAEVKEDRAADGEPKANMHDPET
jgi:hypothetical protein